MKINTITLCWAARNGFEDVVYILLSHGAPINGARIDGGVAFTWACANSHLKVFKALMKRLDTAQVNECDDNGRSPLELVTEAGQWDII
jgi:ankyrin repeat protein